MNLWVRDRKIDRSILIGYIDPCFISMKLRTKKTQDNSSLVMSKTTIFYDI